MRKFARKRMRTFPASIFVAVGCLLLVLVSGCNYADTGGPEVGKLCTIQFRRDALGAAASLPVGPMTDSINGAETSISGKLLRVTTDWLVVERNGKDVWIPQSVVLMVIQQ
jgi:hypothetical protein